MLKRYTLFALLSVMLFACSSDQPAVDDHELVASGSWSMELDLDGTLVPVRMSIDTNLSVNFYNASELISAGKLAFKNDSFYLEMPVYGTYFQGALIDAKTLGGYWHNTQKGAEYLIPFSAVHTAKSVDSYIEINQPIKYQVEFSPNTDDAYPAIGLFSVLNGKAEGTFITETGDYRFLEGFSSGENLTLSCFDGSHLFHFKADIKGDSLTNGVFKSGTHWTEPFSAVMNETFELTHPDSLTQVIDNSPLILNLVNTEGDFVTFQQEDFEGKVTLVQIMGTWCPNCLDESKFYGELYNEYHSQGLTIIPVAFERTDDFQTSSITLKRYLDDLGLPYQGYIGGRASKSLASEAFPMLSKIISYPTSIYIDKSGVIRKIHTGFYGPGTGMYYDRYKSSTNKFLQELLSE